MDLMRWNRTWSCNNVEQGSQAFSTRVSGNPHPRRRYESHSFFSPRMSSESKSSALGSARARLAMLGRLCSPLKQMLIKISLCY